LKEIEMNFLEKIKTIEKESDSAVPSKELQEETYYHGTQTEEKALKIWNEGIRPDLAQCSKRSTFRPVAGRVYCTKFLREAVVYLLGGSYVGHKMLPQLEEKYGRYGYLFVIPGNLLEDVHPDEDQVGKAVYDAIEDADEDLPWIIPLAQKYVKPAVMKSLKDGLYASWIRAGKAILPHLTDEQKLALIEK
jgi:hypothetical protein